MHPDRPIRTRERPAARLVVGICLVLLYLLAATPLAPVITSLLAMADRTHQLAIEATTHGIQVVLRHGGAQPTGHHHGLVARTLTSIAQRTVGGGHADHIIRFDTCAASSLASALPPGPPGEWTLDVPASEPLFSWDQSPRLARLLAIGAPATHPRPPPSAPGALLSAQSTVLLI